MGLEKIGQIRKEKGLTIEELSIKSGVPISTIKKISAGITTNPNLDTVKALAKALQCKLDDFDNNNSQVTVYTDSALEIAKAYDKAPLRDKNMVRMALNLPLIAIDAVPTKEEEKPN